MAKKTTKKMKATPKLKANSKAKATSKSKSKAKAKPAPKTARKVTAKSAQAVTGKKLAKAAGTSPKSARAVVGQPVPGWAAPATGDQIVSSDSLRGKNVVLYFYPKDKTPGCTIEGHDFTKLHKSFQDSNTEVYGISRDSMKLHESFKECEGYSIDLLSDEDETLCRIFDVIKMKNMYGKQVRGIERSTFVIDGAGRLVKEWRGVKVPGHAEEVLDFVKGLD